MDPKAKAPRLTLTFACLLLVMVACAAFTSRATFRSLFSLGNAP